MDGLNPNEKLFRDTYYTLFNSRNGTKYGLKPVPRFDGGTAVSGRHYKAVWPRLTAVLAANGIAISDYLETIMFKYDIRSPQDTVRPAYISDYLEKVEHDDSVRIRWNIEEKLLVNALKIRVRLGDRLARAFEKVLADSSIDVSPLVKYTFARLNQKDAWITQELTQAAWRQFLERRAAYLKWCSERIPKEWRS